MYVADWGNHRLGVYRADKAAVTGREYERRGVHSHKTNYSRKREQQGCRDMSRSAFIFDDDEQVGDVVFFNNGQAKVMSRWSDTAQRFDNPETGHEDALRYIRSRISPAFTLVEI